MKIDLAEPKTDQEFEAYYRLRYERLREEHGLPAGSERDHPAEAGSSHLIASVDGRIVGAACWAVGISRADPPARRELYVRFRQMAVDRDFEGHGIGIVMSRHVERFARGLGARQILGNVRPHRVPYFEHLGYVVNGKGETLFGTIEHLSMVKALR